MDKEQINLKANEVSTRINGINNWIKANPQVTEPNWYEITNCLVEVGEVVRDARLYYDKKGYPTLKKEGTEERREATHYDIVFFDEDVNKCWEAFGEMRKLRNIEFRKDEFITNNKEALDMFTELVMRAQIGEYDKPKDPQIAAIKKEVLCKSMSVPFYVHQVQRNEPNYQYDNEQEFTAMKESYDIYKEAVGVQGAVAYGTMEDAKLYKGPQFGLQIENCFALINRNYKFKEETTEKTM